MKSLVALQKKVKMLERVLSVNEVQKGTGDEITSLLEEYEELRRQFPLSPNQERELIQQAVKELSL